MKPWGYLIVVLWCVTHTWSLPGIGQALSQSESQAECAPWQCRASVKWLTGVISPMEGVLSSTDGPYRPNRADEQQPYRDALMSELMPPTMYWGFGLEFNYYQALDMDLRIQYARPEVRNSYGTIIPLHQAIIEAGFALNLYGRWEAGLGMHFTSAREKLAKPMLLEDNESDFGHYIRWSSPRYRILQTEWGVGLSQWSAWTLPYWTEFIGVELQGVYRLW